MQLTVTFMVHEGGTKYYTVITGIDPAAPAHFQLNCWGKYRSGYPVTLQSRSEHFQDEEFCRSSAIKQEKAKVKRGYTSTNQDGREALALSYDVPDLEQLEAFCETYGLGQNMCDAIHVAARESGMTFEMLPGEYKKAIKNPLKPSETNFDQYEEAGAWS